MEERKKKKRNSVNLDYVINIYSELKDSEKIYFLNDCFDKLDPEKRRFFFNRKKEGDNLSFKIEACNDNVSIAVDHSNKKLRKCCNLCCFLPSSCCYVCSLFMRLFISSVFILMILFGLIMIKKIFI
jgi:hypothetical protein